MLTNPPVYTPPALNVVVPLASLSAAEPGACIPRNASTWHQVGEFLTVQHLASLGLRMLP